ncbi:MAG TPA: helix-turn-helix domain-containing protein [Jatrophihabitans sp.]|nr:helix-turn-helix domain-containing protein [Jatrophihabitans sp.]
MDDAVNRPFAEVLRASRQRAGLTQKALADLSTVSPRAIRDIESGRANARPQTVLLLADGLRLHGMSRELFVQAGRPVDTSATDSLPSMPTPISAILGRETELRAMTSALESGRRRIIFMSGLPGAGKTRLAAEVAARLGAARGWPVLWAAMAAHGEAPHRRTSGPFQQPLRVLIESGGHQIWQLGRLVGRHEVLLVLDGVTEPEPVAGVEELLSDCPGIRVISTSRTSWHIAGVQPSVICPLAVPASDWGAGSSHEELANVPSVRLLTERLCEVVPGTVLTEIDLAAAAELCRKLDGLPIALEAAVGSLLVSGLRDLARASVAELLELTVPNDVIGTRTTLGDLISSRLQALSGPQHEILGSLARWEQQWPITELARTVRRPVSEVVDDLSTLIRSGLILTQRTESGTDLCLPNLVRARLLGRQARPAAGVRLNTARSMQGSRWRPSDGIGRNDTGSRAG